MLGKQTGLEVELGARVRGLRSTILADQYERREKYRLDGSDGRKNDEGWIEYRNPR
jgi:hypothetical protein